MPGTFDLDEQHADLDAKVVAALERLGSALRGLLRTEARKHGLSPIQLQLLIQIGQRAAGEQVGALAARFDVTAPTVSDAVASLVAKGLVERREGVDRRTVLLALTPQGEEVKLAAEGWADGVRAHVASLSPTARYATFDSLTALIERLQDDGVVTLARMCRTCRFLRRVSAAEPGGAPEGGGVSEAEGAVAGEGALQGQAAGEAPSGSAPYWCALLELPLKNEELRLDCPDHRSREPDRA